LTSTKFPQEPQFKENEQSMLLSGNQLLILYQEVQIETLIIEGFNLEAIVEKLNLPKYLIMKIQKSMDI
jgi:hypothetical protein